MKKLIFISTTLLALNSYINSSEKNDLKRLPAARFVFEMCRLAGYENKGLQHCLQKHQNYIPLTDQETNKIYKSEAKLLDPKTNNLRKAVRDCLKTRRAFDIFSENPVEIHDCLKSKGFELKTEKDKQVLKEEAALRGSLNKANFDPKFSELVRELQEERISESKV